jgi:hypothetical protein
MEPDLQPTEHSMEARIARLESDSVKVWGLTLSMTMTGVMLTVMARAFGWI